MVESPNASGRWQRLVAPLALAAYALCGLFLWVANDWRPEWDGAVYLLLAKSLAASLYQEDITIHWQHMQDYSKPELQGDEWTPSELPDTSIARKAI